MRIVAGKYGGRRLAKPTEGIRPTTDRLRESLFNVLGSAVQDSLWLDAFAGSGAVGIEALSRGAALVVFNDRSRESVRLVERNLKLCGISEGFEIHCKDALTLLNQMRGRSFGFVFLDPAYGYRRYDKLLAKVAETILPPPTVILEIFKKTPVDFLPPEWSVTRTVKAGDSHLLFIHQPRPTL